VYDNSTGQVKWQEQNLYGSSRLGTWKPSVTLTSGTAAAKWDTIGNKYYELDNHLGNVLAVVTDKRLQNGPDTTVVTSFNAEVNSAQDYFAFGAIQNYRNFNSGKYRYGFNGKENDNEVKQDYNGNNNIGAQQDYGERIYDPRIGRFLSVDPLAKNYPWLTPYQFASNRPIDGVDLDGLEYAPSMSRVLFGAAGITTASAKQIEADVQERLPRVMRDALYVMGGTVTIIGSGGTATPVVLGTIAVGGGAAKVYFDSKGDSETADQVPTTATGTVMVTANYVVGKKVFSQQFISVAEFSEGVLTLDLKNFKSANLMDKGVISVNALNLAIDYSNTSDNFKALFDNVVIHNNDNNKTNAKPDALYVAPKTLMPLKVKKLNITHTQKNSELPQKDKNNDKKAPQATTLEDVQ
jgi:RHS repeat-associated protein